MKTFTRISIVVLISFLLGMGCKNEKNEVPPVDSTQILPPGKVDQIILSSGAIYIDTGLTVTIKGHGFDPNMRNNYFLFVKHEDINSIPSDSSLSRDFEINDIIRDTNLVSIDKSTIVFKLPKYSINNITKDSAFIYFTKHKTRDIYNHANEYKVARTVISSTKKLVNTPIYKLLKDTLIISKKYSSINREMIQGSYSHEAIKVMIQGLEYSSNDGYFVPNRDYNVPFHQAFTLLMVATYDKFYLPDGSYSIEIYERNGNQRKFVEETGKTKIYIKNIP